MATTSICAELRNGFDLSCRRDITKRYYQEAVLINHTDIDHENTNVSLMAGASCDYAINLVLKQGRSGVRFKFPDGGNTVKGFVSKSKTDNGFIQYLHQVQIMMTGLSEEQKCILDKLDHGRFVVALQATDGTVEIYGYKYGLTTGDYTNDIVENGGIGVIPLQSDENAQEEYLPLVYKPAPGGSATADFDALFAS